ncbi:MAG: Crp/Fnr family transcriptional regulator [Anaerolineales bacterium]|nr:Crp/Fnr family transcriptional regulator [Anaerolineales bacterium]
MAESVLLSRTIVLLKNLPLLAQLPEETLVNLAEKCTLSHYEADQTIFSQSDRSDRVWIVRLGQVKIVFHDIDGREVIIEMIQPGEAFGGGAIFLPKHPATARTMAPSEIVSFSLEEYEKILLNHPIVGIKLIRMLGQRLFSVRDLSILAGERVERRIAHILLKLSKRVGRAHDEGVMIGIPLARQDLADMSGTTLETAIRLMSRLRKEGIVKTLRGGYVVILDEEKLKEMART